MERVIDDTLERMNIDRYEIVTLYYGADVAEQEAQETVRRIKEHYGHLEIEVVNGGQPYYAYILSAE
jgi:dihydroxyacetone kinase-like predicted kinase